MPVTKKHVGEPATVTDTFASDFEVEEFKDWVRLTCWADYAHARRGDGAELRQSFSIVIPISSVYNLINALRQSTGPEPRSPGSRTQ